jgi:hypothetical protein
MPRLRHIFAAEYLIGFNVDFGALKVYARQWW